MIPPRVARRAAGGGFSLPEMLVALALGLLLVHLGLESSRRLGEARARLAARGDALVALRVFRHVVRRETRMGLGGVDWWSAGDSLALRAFRGAALVCHNDTTSARLVVSYVGDRAPDPAKDSLLLLSADGVREVRALVAASAPPLPCSGLEGGSAALWSLDAPAPPGNVAAKLFERGSYHLSDAALRYRRGAGGRQPLTPEVWSGATAWTRSSGWLHATLVTRDPLAGAPWSGLGAPVAP